MLNFIAYRNGEPAENLNLASAYLLGPEEVPIRSQISMADRLITCKKSIEEAAALVVLWDVKGQGQYLLQTTRLPDRDRPYILNLEMARWRLMRIQTKFEDWGLFDYPKTESINELLNESKKLFIRALQNEQTPAVAADFADQSLEKSMAAGEALAKFHAARMFAPRVKSGNLNRKLFGCRINEGLAIDQISPDILANLNFVTIPINWAELEPSRKKFDLAALDRKFEFFLKRKVTIRLGEVIGFSESQIPEWLRGKNVAFEVLRDLMYEYLTAIASRYGKCIRSWAVLSGLNTDNYFGLNFEQILDLTRLLMSRAKRLCPRASAVIEITEPWGEYYAHNARSVHPFLYSEMVAQSGINFDAFSLRLPFGAASEGRYVRDFFQISSLIDRYSVGKPLHLTTSVPSKTSGESGYWETQWTPDSQAKWFENFSKIALSKSPVETITWDAFGDQFSENIPFGGLMTDKWTSKPVFARIREIEKRLDEARAQLPPE